jgi:TIGR03643 family protein
LLWKKITFKEFKNYKKYIYKFLRNEISMDELIKLAWSDKISFEEINKITGFAEKDVIKIMRKELKPKSFNCWRKRVSGRRRKHRKLNKFRDNDYSLL